MDSPASLDARADQTTPAAMPGKGSEAAVERIADARIEIDATDESVLGGPGDTGTPNRSAPPRLTEWLPWVTLIAVATGVISVGSLAGSAGRGRRGPARQRHLQRTPLFPGWPRAARARERLLRRSDRPLGSRVFLTLFGGQQKVAET